MNVNKRNTNNDNGLKSERETFFCKPKMHAVAFAMIYQFWLYNLNASLDVRRATLWPKKRLRFGYK